LCQKSSEPTKAGKNGILPEKNFGPKITSAVKTAELPEKHRRNRQSHLTKSMESDVPVKEPQLVTIDRANGSVTETCSDQLDNKSRKSLRVENVPN